MNRPTFEPGPLAEADRVETDGQWTLDSDAG